MKYALMVSLLLSAQAAFAARSATALPEVPADTTPAPMTPNLGYSPYSPLSSRVEEKSLSTDNNGHPYDQLLSIQAGPYRPKSMTFTNWNNTTFNYDQSQLGSFNAQLGWGIKMFHIGGAAIYFNEGIGLSSYSLKLSESIIANPGNQSVTLHMFGFDTRLSAAWETFPIASLEPFVEGGALLSLWNQSAPTDVLSGEGTTSNLAAGAGLRFWVNRGSSVNREFPNRYMALPIFLSLKVNEIFSNNQGVDPGSTSVLGGVSIGL